MKSKTQLLQNWKIAIAFSALLPLLSIITSSESQTDFEISMVLTGWFASFCFLLVAWIINSKITNAFFYSRKRWSLFSRILIILFSNALLLSMLIFLGIFVAEDFNSARENNFVFTFFRGFTSIAMIYLVQYSLNMSARNQSISMQNQMLKTENIRARFEILRNQISPHFLFNSLSTLRSMIRSDNSNAESFVIKLSEIYRQLLLKKDRDTITLREELDFVKDYAFLLFERFEDMLTIDIDVDNQLLDYKVPTLSLQVLLENCVKHNEVSKVRPLQIKIFDSGINSITVENNLQQKSISNDDEGLGLNNLIKRYELLGSSDGVKVFSDESVFRVKIKLLEE